MTDTSYRPSNFVVAEPGVEMPRADIIRRQDVIDQVGNLVAVYQEQQRAALQVVSADVGRNGYLSSADAVAERRKTSRLYLLTYTAVSALTMAGVVILAALAGALSNVAALAVWLVGTGVTTLVLAWIRHGDEFKHSPEGIARHLADWHGSISQYESETRRLSLRWEYSAEARRQQAAAQAAADARQQAADRMTELQLRRDIQQAQIERHSAIDSYQISVECQATPEPTIDTIQQADELINSDKVTGATPTWQRDLLAWVGEVYGPDGMTTDGIVRVRAPWSARSTWHDADKAKAKELCTVGRPRFLLASNGGQWKVNIELFDSADVAVKYLSGRMR